MVDVIGRGVIEVSADSTKLRAGIDSAKLSLNSLGIAAQEATKRSSASIDGYVRNLGVAALTTGKTAREAELLKLGLRGATDAQLAAANAALKMSEAHQRGVVVGQALRATLIGITLAAGAGLVGAAVAFDRLTNGAGKFQDMGEKIGDSAEAVASLAVSAKVGGVEMDELVSASVKLSKNLTGVDDDAKAAGAAIKALGLDIDKFKQLGAVERIEAISKALKGFAEGPERGDVLVALFGKSGAQLLPFFNELAGATGRLNILTKEQIALADEHGDKQARLRGQVSLHAQAIASQMLPAYNDLTAAFLDVIKGLAGVKDGAQGLGNEKGIQNFANGAVDAVAFAVDSIDGLVRVLQLAYVQIKTTISAAEAIHTISRAANPVTGTLDFIAGRGSAIENIKSARSTLVAEAEKSVQEVNAILMRSTLRGALAARRNTVPGPDDKPDNFDLMGKRRLIFDGAALKDKKGTDTAAQEAKARLQQDLSDIINSSKVLEHTFRNGEQILEAMRSAGLVEEAAYYEQKRDFLNLNNIAQEASLKAQIERLQKEKLVGKDAIDNDRKIAEARAKLTEAQGDAATQQRILSIQEAASAVKLKQYYADAEAAAQSYIDTLRRANAAQLAGFGAGNLARDRLSGRQQIEDKYDTERRQLEKSRRDAELMGGFGPEAQRKYDDEVARIQRFQTQALGEFETYYSKRLALEGDWTNGAREALQNYYDESRNTAKLTETVWTNALKSIEDALVTFVMTGKLDFKSLVNSIIADLARIEIRKALGSVSSGLLGMFGDEKGVAAGPGGMGTDETAGTVGFLAKIAGLFSSYAVGTDYVPKTGLAMIHQGERIIPAAENKAGAWGGGAVVNHITFHVTGAIDRGTQSQIANRIGHATQRAMARDS